MFLLKNKMHFTVKSESNTNLSHPQKYGLHIWRVIKPKQITILPITSSRNIFPKISPVLINAKKT